MNQIRLSKGLFALVSPEDYEWLCQWKWHASNESNGKKWYAVRFAYSQGKRIKVRMHREVLFRKLQNCLSLSPEVFGLVVDHDNHNSLDNRRENLNLMTQRENMLKCPGWKRRKGQE